MKIYIDIESLEEHEPWCGATYWYNKIIAEDKGKEFIQFLEEICPEGMTSTTLNDILWFDDDLIKDFLGIEGDKE